MDLLWFKCANDDVQDVVFAVLGFLAGALGGVFIAIGCILEIIPEYTLKSKA